MMDAQKERLEELAELLRAERALEAQLDELEAAVAQSDLGRQMALLQADLEHTKSLISMDKHELEIEILEEYEATEQKSGLLDGFGRVIVKTEMDWPEDVAIAWAIEHKASWVLKIDGPALREQVLAMPTPPGFALIDQVPQAQVLTSKVIKLGGESDGL